MIGQGRPTISAVVAALVWLAGAAWLSAQEVAAPSDSLRIIAHRDPLIFAPGEQFTFDLEPLLAGVEPSTTIDIAASLTPAQSRTTRWNTQQRLPIPFDGPAIATLHVPLPREEGVYEVHLEVTRPPGFRERWFPGGAGAPIIERSFQVVVLDRLPKPPAADAEWRRIVEVDTANPAWSAKLPDWTQIRRIPGMSRRPIGSVRARPVTSSLGTFMELPSTPPSGEAHWQAYPLAIEGAGGPHLLEVEYTNEQEQHLGISIVEPDSAGRLVTIGRDSGVYVEGLGASERVERQKHQIVFWPRTNAPLVLVTNQHPTAVARFGHIRVYRRTASTLAIEPWQSLPLSGRLVTAYLANPIRAGATTADGAATSDWLKLYDSAVQLTEYLNYAGFNSAAINVMASEAPLVPAAVFDSPGQPDISPLTAAADMPPADGLELLLRVFDRSGLVLVPTLDFTTPLPTLETLRQQVDPHSGGIELVGPTGLTWQETHTSDPQSNPRYNLLDPRVQQAALEMAQGIVTRYGRHPSFQLIAVQLSARGFGVLPGPDWGLDDTTIGRFEQETGIRLRIEGPNRFATRHALLTGKYADLWRRWRAEQVTRFYQQLAQTVAVSSPQRRLLLTSEGIFDAAEAAGILRPNVTEKPNLEQALLELGIDWTALQQSPGVVIVPTRIVESMTPLVDRAMDLSINETFASRQSSSPATLIYHRPQSRPLAALAALQPFGLEGSPLSQSAAHGAAARQPYVTALLADDPSIVFEGGETPPLGREEEVRQLRAILRSLPQAVAVTAHRENNVSVRTYNDRGQTIWLVINECPWHADVTLDLTAESPTTARPLIADPQAGAPETPEQFMSGQQLWSLQLEPYEVRAVQFPQAAPKITRIESLLSEPGRQELAAKVSELKERDLTATPRFTELANPGFEPVGPAAQPQGWQFVGDAAQAQAELDANNPQEQQTCLHLENRGGGVAAIVSDPFPVPPTGQLGMLTFIRGVNVDRNTSVRLVFEIDGQPVPYRRFSVLGGNRPDAIPIAADWGGGYAFGQDDLPLDSRARMRVKFELVGPGEIWIDNVQLYDLLFPLSFYSPGGRERLQLVKRRAEVVSELEHGELADCVRTLEGYWPRFINAYTPRVEPQMVNQPPVQEPPVPPGEKPSAEAIPSVGSRPWYNFWSK